MSSINSVVSSILEAYYETSASVASTTSASTTTTASTTSSDDTTSYSSKTALGRYLNSTSTDDVTDRTIFEKLSIDVGGDGKTISKDALSSYIDKAKAGTVTIPDEELSSLNDLLDNWDSASDDDEQITYSRLVSTGYDADLTSMIPSSDDNSYAETLKEDCENSTIEAYSKIVNAAFSGISSSDSDDSDFSVVKSLLSLEDSNDTSSTEELLLKLISSGMTSTVELEA